MKLSMDGSPHWVGLQKRFARLARDPLRIQPLIQAKDITVLQEPFPHVVIDDMFVQEAHQRIERHFDRILSRGLSETKSMERFQPFLMLKGKYAYDGYVYGLRPLEPGSPLFLFSLDWNLFFSELFNIPTGWNTSAAYHYHPPHNKTGWVHNDLSQKPFFEADRMGNGVIPFSREGQENLALFNEVRGIALIYYFGNGEWAAGDGGETGLYESETGAPIKLVEPKNNRLLAFPISRKSFHAFQANQKQRRSLVQWFHIPNGWRGYTPD